LGSISETAENVAGNSLVFKVDTAKAGMFEHGFLPDGQIIALP